MNTQTATVQKRNVNVPDEIRSFPHGTLRLVDFEGTMVSRITLHPGWRWSTDVKPLAKTESCQVRHVQYIISGRLMIAMNDGMEMELQPGDAAVIPPGHDAWVVGQDDCEIVDFSDMKDYGKNI